jgi:pilus assembly protein Flp/PilA
MKMAKTWGFFARLRKDENGATMVEYSILIGIITAATILIIMNVGGFVNTAWNSLCNNLNSTGVACAAVAAAP